MPGPPTTITGSRLNCPWKPRRSARTALLLTVPAYNKPSQEGLYQNFKAIAEATSLPGILYNVPSRTSLNMTHETTLRLAEIENIVGVKEASSDPEQITRIIDGAPDGFRVWSGNDDETFSIMCTGGYGIVSVAAHIVGTPDQGDDGAHPGRRHRGRRRRASQVAAFLQGHLLGDQSRAHQVRGQSRRIRHRYAQTAALGSGRRLQEQVRSPHG